MLSGLFLTTTISIAVILNHSNNLKAKEARLEEIASRKMFEAEAEIEQARKESQEASVVIEKTERLKQKSFQTNNKVEIIQRKSTKIRKAISPRDFIKKHYSDLNNRNYYSTLVIINFLLLLVAIAILEVQILGILFLSKIPNITLMKFAIALKTFRKIDIYQILPHILLLQIQTLFHLLPINIEDRLYKILSAKNRLSIY